MTGAAVTVLLPMVRLFDASVVAARVVVFPAMYRPEEFCVELAAEFPMYMLADVIVVFVMLFARYAYGDEVYDDPPMAKPSPVIVALTVLFERVSMLEDTAEFSVLLPTLIEVVVRLTLAPTFMATEAFDVPVMSRSEVPVIRPEAFIVFAFSIQRDVVLPR